MLENQLPQMRETVEGMAEVYTQSFSDLVIPAFCIKYFVSDDNSKRKRTSSLSLKRLLRRALTRRAQKER